MQDLKLNVILAIDRNFLFGTKENTLPWPRKEYKEDLRHFYRITSNTKSLNYMICGWRTYQSMIGLKFKNRRLVVINRDAVGIDYYGEDGPIHVKSLQDAFKMCQRHQYIKKVDKVFLVGGKKYIEKTLNDYYPMIDTLYVTQIKKAFKGEVYLDRNIFTNFYLSKVEKLNNMHFCEYKVVEKISEEIQYLDILNNILRNGIDCDDRTGVGIKSIFGTQMRFDLSKSFPLLTTKKMFTRGITEELLWFLRGETNAKILQQKNVHIWDGNTSREFLDNVGLQRLAEGDIGETYGFLFRHFGAEYKGYQEDYTGKGFDQVAYVLDQIKNNPNSRRIIMSLWKPPFYGRACLPPCLFLYQFRVYNDTLSCSIYQRSADMGLGVPFNIASASLMTYIFAHLAGLKPGMLIHSLGDSHIYKNHIDAMREQLQRYTLPFPKLRIKNRGQKNVEDYVSSDFEILGYMCHPRIKMDMAV